MIEELIRRHPALAPCRADIEAAAALLVDCYRRGGKVLACGNGGSAADSEHICGELLKKFRRPRPIPPAVATKLPKCLADALEGGLPAVSLVSMSGILTAFANDVGWETVFAQQVLALARPEDTLVTLSTSGNSVNCVAAAETMRAVGGRVIALTGAAESSLSSVADIAIRVPTNETYLVQELHLPIYHFLCAFVEKEMFP